MARISTGRAGAASGPKRWVGAAGYAKRPLSACALERGDRRVLEEVRKAKGEPGVG